MSNTRDVRKNKTTSWCRVLTGCRWAIRNCGMMLFKALLTRLATGSSSSSAKTVEGHRRTAKSTYKKYPRLTELLIEILQDSDRAVMGVQGHITDPYLTQLAFPAMELVEKIGVLPAHQKIVRELLVRQLSNPLWNLRDKAARTLSIFIDETSMIDGLNELTASAPFISQNHLHGSLLCLCYLIDTQTLIVSKEVGPDVLERTTRLFDVLVTSNKCPATVSIYFGLLLCFFRRVTAGMSEAHLTYYDLLVLRAVQQEPL